MNQRILSPAVFSLFLLACTNTSTSVNSNDHIQYEFVNAWPKLPSHLKLSQVTGVALDSSLDVFLIHRAGRELLDAESGAVKKTWGENIFIMPHGLATDQENNVWITDVGLHQVLKFSHDGKLLMTLGEAKMAGSDSMHFNRPTDVAISREGKIYISDGYLNSRILCYSPTGKYLFEWGTKGGGPGQFDIPHGIAIDVDENIYVADRENNRIQKFDSNGRFLNEWKNDRATQLYSVMVDRKKAWAIDYHTIGLVLIKGSDILQFDSSLKITSRFGRAGNYDGPISRYHDITGDSLGNIYVGDILNNTIQKFRKVMKE